MSTKLAEAYVQITGDDSDLDATLARSEGALTRFVGRANSGLATLALGAGVAALGGVTAALVDAARKAGDLRESVSKVDSSFGPAARGMHAEAERLAKQFGVVKREALDASSAFGLMGLAAGLSKQKAADLGVEFTRLGIDLASYHNLTNSEAFEKLRSGLAGEAEPLRPLGIMLSEDAVKAEALASGLIKTKRELTEQEKVLGRLSLIRRTMTDLNIVGDRERTGDSTNNQLKQLQGDLENFQTKVGEALLSPLAEAIKLARELGTDFEKTFGTAPIEAFGAALKTAIATGRTLREQGGDNPAVQFGKAVLNPGKALVDLAKEGVRQFGLGPGAGGAPGVSATDAANKAAGNVDRTPAIKGASIAERNAALRDKAFRERAAYFARLIAIDKQGKEFTDRQAAESWKRLGRGLLSHALGQLGALPGALSGDRLTALASQGKLAGGGLFGGGGGNLLLRGALEGARKIAANGYNPDANRTLTGHFQGGLDLNHAIQDEIFSKGGVQEKQLKELEAAGAKLAEIKEGIGETVKALRERVVARFSGRS